MSELGLWRSVINEALSNATDQFCERLTETRRACLRDEARSWIMRFSPDFVLACALAGLEPEAVRDELRRRFADPALARQRIAANRVLRRLAFPSREAAEAEARWYEIHQVADSVISKTG